MDTFHFLSTSGVEHDPVPMAPKETFADRLYASIAQSEETAFTLYRGNEMAATLAFPGSQSMALLPGAKLPAHRARWDVVTHEEWDGSYCESAGSLEVAVKKLAEWLLGSLS